MASTKVRIPTIDFSNIELKPKSSTSTPLWESTKIQVFEALQEYGCFVAIYDDKVFNEIREGLFGAIKGIFEFPIETKLRNSSEKPYLSYLLGMRDGCGVPLYESLCIPDLLNPQSVQDFANIFWPQDGNPDFCNLVKSYSNPLVEMDEKVKRMVLESLGLENHIDEFMDANYMISRFTRYKGSSSLSGDVTSGVIGHNDGGFLTVVSQNQVNGLQFKKDEEWIDVNFTAPNSYVVIAGDSFKAWTNGRVHSPFHRVAVTEEGERFSIQLFSSAKPGHIIEAPKELVDEQHPLLFKPFETLALYDYLSSQAAYGGYTDLFKTYCGV